MQLKPKLVLFTPAIEHYKKYQAALQEHGYHTIIATQITDIWAIWEQEIGKNLLIIVDLEGIGTEAYHAFCHQLRHTKCEDTPILLFWNGQTPLTEKDRKYLIPGDIILSPIQTPELLLRVQLLWEKILTLRNQGIRTHQFQIYRTLFEQAGIGVAQLESHTGKFVQINRKYSEIIGYTNAEIQKLRFHDITYPEDLQPDLQLMEQLIQGEIREFSMEKRLLKKDGTPFWVRLWVSPMWDVDEAADYHIAIIEDIDTEKQTQNAQVERAQRFQRMFERHDAMMLLIEPETGQIVDANLAASQFYGYDRPTLKTMSIQDINQLDTGEVKDEMRRAVDETRNYFIFPHRLANGEIRMVEVHSTPLEMEERSLLFSIIHDITQRQQAEQALRQSEEQYRNLFENAPIGIGVADMRGNLLAFNDAMMKPGNYTRDDILAMGAVQELYYDLAQRQAILESLMKEGMVSRREVLFKKKDGGYYPAFLTLVPIRFEGQPGILALAEDISEQKAAETRLIESEARYRRIVETAEEGIWMVDANSMTTFANSKMADMLHCDSVDDMLGKSLSDFMDEEGMAISKRNIERRRQGIRETHDFKLLTQTGQPLWVSMATSPIMDETGNYQGALAMVMDMTERRKSEEHIKAALAEREVLLREIHHRVKNNFQVILSLLNLQGRKIPDTKVVQPLIESKNRIRSMALVHEKMYQSDRMSEVNFGDYLHYLTRELYASEMPKHTIALEFELASVLLNIEQAIPCGLLVNELISNAFRYAFPTAQSDAQVKIGLVESEEGEVLLQIADNGQGLPPSFNWQTIESLGLQLVKRLINQLDGECELSRDEGTCWTLRFYKI